MSEQKPSVGRIVHYVSHGTPPGPTGAQAYRRECRAAVVTEVPSGVPDPQTIGLCVLNPTGQFFDRSVSLDPGTDPAADSTERAMCDGYHHRGGTWHWPGRV